jgi:acylphosphatase
VTRAVFGAQEPPTDFETQMRISRRYVISGRVQGVGFRYFTQAAATAEGLSGWVRNTPDGRVEVDAEGEADALARFEQRISRGPAGARVEHVEATDAASGARGPGFHIR